MLQSKINQAFRESVLHNSKGFQYPHTRDFVTALRRCVLVTDVMYIMSVPMRQTCS